ncbi:hypothetical protein VTN00DRAFT_5184 [Thermoascus crustaceus]|uniref:uncharacterized protein n=1 Tax=Thermoascus crustaceus TaxID=5088 RepID=UPI0037438DE0
MTSSLPLRLKAGDEQQDRQLSRRHEAPSLHKETGRRHAQHCTVAENAGLSRIFSLTPVPTVVLDSSLRVVQVSASHLAFSRLTQEECLGVNIYALPPSKIPAPDVATIRGAIRTAVATQAVQVIDDVQVSPDSYFSLRVTPIHEGTGLLYVILEANEIVGQRGKRKVPSEPLYVNETYRILVDTVKDYAIFMLDTEGYIATWNTGAAILKGYDSQEIIGQHFSVFYGDDDRRADKPGKELDACLRDGRVEDEGWRYRKDGSRFWANVMISAIYHGGCHVGFAKVTRDLTERKAAEARLISAFEESSKIKSEFLANVSHEIRTPMHGMLLALMLLSGTDLDEKQREYASIIEDSGSILLRVINDVLDYSKLSSGSFSITTDVLSVVDVMEAVVRNYTSTLKPGVELDKSVERDFPKHVRGDPLRYRQILQNLVGNAVKFTEKGYVRVRSTFSEDKEDSSSYNILTEVIDTGIGVPEDALGYLFNPFTRFADSNTKRYQGTGLGLSICKSLAELMSGSVGFRPNPDGQGSIFWFTVKMGKLDNAQPENPSTPALSTPDPCAEVKTIAPRKQLLLVEDNIMNQTVMLKVLKSIGFEKVDTAWDGAEAVRLVKQKPFSYNAILMDINMPLMNGLDATKEIRDMKLEMPIIAMTGNALKGDSETYLAKGMNDYVAKPVSRLQLVRILLKWIGS